MYESGYEGLQMAWRGQDYRAAVSLKLGIEGTYILFIRSVYKPYLYTFCTYLCTKLA